MYCQKRITHTIEAGDTLYKLAKHYGTTVTELILGNPGANPYNLQIGAKLQICPSEKYWMETEGNQIDGNHADGNQTNGNQTNSNTGNVGAGIGTVQNKKMQKAFDDMRLAWLSQIYWIRMYLMSVMSQAGDQQEVEERMMETPDEITDVFAEYLPIGVTRSLRTLLVQLTERIGEAVRNLAAGMPYDFDAWKSDADQIAELLERHNAYFGNENARNRLLNYLELTRKEIEEQMEGMYAKSIDTFRDLKEGTLDMADFFVRGLFVC